MKKINIIGEEKQGMSIATVNLSKYLNELFKKLE